MEWSCVALCQPGEPRGPSRGESDGVARPLERGVESTGHRNGGRTAPDGVGAARSGRDEGEESRLIGVSDGRRRVAITEVRPEVDGGRFAAKHVEGEDLSVEANVFADGHDELAAVVRYRRDDGGDDGWSEVAMAAVGNDRWRAQAPLRSVGSYRFTIVGWVDRFATWRRDLGRKVDAGYDVAVELLAGAELVAAAASRARPSDAIALNEVSELLADTSRAQAERVALALEPELGALMVRWPDRAHETVYPVEVPVVVDRARARFSAWYELFPRSCASEPGRHGTLADVVARLDMVAEMGFDVLYLPPIHPIGRVNRKGRNNTTDAGPEDVGSPWAIGAAEGGHTAIHPALGGIEDFRALCDAASARGLEVALDLAFQCAPDHPWVAEHPSWFRRRPDGTVQFAENPPKRYEDIYPLDFESDDWEELWQALLGVVDFWIGNGVRIFRVDNPHTKPFAFWEWLIGEVRRDHPDVIFLSEAFTRPAVMYRLAKLGFTQSYNYFPWRNTRWELETYFTELTATPVREFFRASLWPNTPDILTEFLQMGGRPAFAIRLLLAATLGASYGIYGPAFELLEDRPLHPGSEEYLDSEKYQIRSWDTDRADGLRDVIARVNAIRRDNPALQRDDTLRFHPSSNEQLLCFSKRSADGADAVVVVVTLDPHYVQSGWIDLDLDVLGIDPERPFQAHDLLGQGRYLWRGSRNYVEIDPHALPGQVFRLRRRVRTERDFDYYL